MSVELLEKPVLDENVYKKKVVLYNDDVNNFDYVIHCVMEVCDKTEEEAEKIVKEAHSEGRAICFVGSEESCETVAEKLSNCELTVGVQ